MRTIPRKTRVSRPLAGLALALLLAGSLFAGEPPAGEEVVEIVVRGNRTVSEERIRGELRTKVGRPLRVRLLKEDLGRVARIPGVIGMPRGLCSRHAKPVQRDRLERACLRPS